MKYIHTYMHEPMEYNNGSLQLIVCRSREVSELVEYEDAIVNCMRELTERLEFTQFEHGHWI